MGLLLTKTISDPVTFKAGLVRTVPLTITRPSAIQISPSRREHMPERANTLAIRSPLVVTFFATMPHSNSMCQGDKGALTDSLESIRFLACKNLI